MIRESRVSFETEVSQQGVWPVNPLGYVCSLQIGCRDTFSGHSTAWNRYYSIKNLIWYIIKTCKSIKALIWEPFLIIRFFTIIVLLLWQMFSVYFFIQKINSFAELYCPRISRRPQMFCERKVKVAKDIWNKDIISEYEKCGFSSWRKDELQYDGKSWKGIVNLRPWSWSRSRLWRTRLAHRVEDRGLCPLISCHRSTLEPMLLPLCLPPLHTSKGFLFDRLLWKVKYVFVVKLFSDIWCIVENRALLYDW